MPSGSRSPAPSTRCRGWPRASPSAGRSSTSSGSYGRRQGGPTTPLAVATLATPIGPLEVLTKGGILCGITFEGYGASIRRWLERRFGEIAIERHDSLGEVTDRLTAYFTGDIKAVDPLPVDTGGTTFQRRVWEALRKIEPGRTVSYGDVAKTIWRPGACRAVGTASGRNPIPVVIPCHRVVSADGTLGGYGGGLDRKKWLLSHEQGQSYIIR